MSSFILVFLLGYMAAILTGMLVALFFRTRIQEAMISKGLCNDLTAALAQSERERKILLGGLMDASAELEAIRGEKRKDWGIPDGM